MQRGEFMAFESLPGVKVFCRDAEQTFIAGDFFAVYDKGADTPIIFCWSQVKSITESRYEFIVSVKGTTFYIQKHSFPNEKAVLNMRAVLESAVSFNPQIDYNHLKRILPPKNLCLSGDMSGAAHTATGFYKEREINFSNVILLNTRLGKLFKILAIVTIITVFVSSHFLTIEDGGIPENWFHLLPISIFAGGISVMLVYLVCAVIANYHFSYLYKVDPAVSEEINFAVSEEGFSAVESHLDTGFEFIPWTEANYFIETNSVFIVYKHKKAVFWLPKRLFEKPVQQEISKFIAARLNQK
jgi:hypothetical protein